jgi:uncharacterized protein YjiS (DUF1127 family)
MGQTFPSSFNHSLRAQQPSSTIFKSNIKEMSATTEQKTSSWANKYRGVRALSNPSLCLRLTFPPGHSRRPRPTTRPLNVSSVTNRFRSQRRLRTRLYTPHCPRSFYKVTSGLCLGPAPPISPPKSEAQRFRSRKLGNGEVPTQRKSIQDHHHGDTAGGT